jgi:hypothetical protein
MTRVSRQIGGIVVAILLGWMVPKVLAHSIDYIATDIQPQAIFTGQSGHFRVIDPVAPGTTITFNLTFELVESSGGPTTIFPATVTFGVQNTGGGLAANAVKFGTPSTTLTDTIVHTYDKVVTKTTALMTPVTAYAPNTPGSYHFKIAAIDGVKGRGLTPGDGMRSCLSSGGKVCASSSGNPDVTYAAFFASFMS